MKRPQLIESELTNLIKRTINEQTGGFIPSYWPPLSYAFTNSGTAKQCQMCKQMAVAYGFDWQQKCSSPCMNNYYSSRVDCLMCKYIYGSSPTCQTYCGIEWHNMWKPKPCYKCGGRFGDKIVEVEDYWYNGHSQGPCWELNPPLARREGDLDCEPKRAYDDLKHTNTGPTSSISTSVGNNATGEMNESQLLGEEEACEKNSDCSHIGCGRAKCGGGECYIPWGSDPCEPGRTTGNGKTKYPKEASKHIMKIKESDLINIIRRSINESQLITEGPYCNGAGQDPATHGACHTRGVGCLNMDDGYFGHMGQCSSCDPEWACVSITPPGTDGPLEADIEIALTKADLSDRECCLRMDRDRNCVDWGPCNGRRSYDRKELNESQLLVEGKRCNDDWDCGDGKWCGSHPPCKDTCWSSGGDVRLPKVRGECAPISSGNVQTESHLNRLIKRTLNETQLLLNEEINYTWECAGSGPNRCLCTCKADNGCGTMTGNKIKDCKAHCGGHCLRPYYDDYSGYDNIVGGRQ